jgi:hypothetical protein
LADVSSQTQALLAQINAQNARLSESLTQQTDEILRGGGRLAYEVELLRGEAVGLAEVLDEGLKDDIQKFVPASDEPKIDGLDGEDRPAWTQGRGSAQSIREGGNQERNGLLHGDGLLDPPFLAQLRILTEVRARLEEVINAFGDAMEWPLPPSEISVNSSFISVSSPESISDSQSREEKGQAVAKKFRNDIMNLLDGEAGEAGMEAAENRIQALRELALLWKGTAEERARIKFIDSLSKMVHDRRKQLGLPAEKRPGTFVEKSPGFKRGKKDIRGAFP